ncbi:hypothetical protein C1H46_015870 [Malus baccata]|uniref:GOST seven transmembrane domain-containing protein n=1 Tax=Malus baccata TaxID=106549 RepID=A0A540MKB0_MALBA|nr:hypothetical protein C1H46_015870 [Malus baccata]
MMFEENRSPAVPPCSSALSLFESIIFRRTKESAEKKNEMQQRTGLVEAIVLEVRDREKIGGSYLNSNAICCTPELSKDGSCKVGEVIIQQNPDNPDGPKRFQTFFEGKNEEANMDIQTIEINSTGMYYLYFMFCDPELVGTLISGRTVWRNPDGYLPGKMSPLMTFFGLMSLAYLVLGLFWFLRFLQYWKDIIQLHYHISAVIGLGMCEMALWYFEYANFNSTGSRPMGITIWAVTFSAVKKTVSRLLLLVVSMGYGVVRPTLGGITSKVLLLGVIYFVASEALELVEHLGNINDFSGKARLFLVLPVALLDACFILWIFSSLSKTLEKLQIRRSMAKLELYRKFTNSLAVSVLLSVAWIGYELYFNATDPLSELWRRAWVIPAFWTLLAYLLLAVICVLWAPSHNPTGYAYSEETTDDFDDEGISLTGSGVKVAGGDLATKLERKERKASSAAEHHEYMSSPYCQCLVESYKVRRGGGGVRRRPSFLSPSGMKKGSILLPLLVRITLPQSVSLSPSHFSYFLSLSSFLPHAFSCSHCAHTVHNFPDHHGPNPPPASRQHPASPRTSFPIVVIEAWKVHNFPAIFRQVSETLASFFVPIGQLLRVGKDSGDNMQKPVSFLHFGPDRLDRVGPAGPGRTLLVASPDRSDPFCCIAGPVGPFLLPRWTGSDKLNRFEPDVGTFLLLRWTGSDKLNRFEPDVPGRTVSAASLNRANRVGQDDPGQTRRTGSDGRTGSDR